MRRGLKREGPLMRIENESGSRNIRIYTKYLNFRIS
jgi:hypothetical protein